MEARELRLGNWVSYCGELDKVDAIYHGTIHTLQYSSILPDDIEPIPITEDWLLRLGFELGSDICGECYFKEHPEPEFAIHVYDGLFVWLSNDKNINYVHELQNLFYVITGEELTLKQE